MLVLFWATLDFVGWVEPAPGFVGFRCTQPNLHFAGVIANCKTQQRPISEPSPSFHCSGQVEFHINLIEKETSMEPEINKRMVSYAILVVGAASSRDYS